MSAEQTIAEIVARIEQAMRRFDQAIAPLSPGEMQEPRLSNGWSVKDMLAHIRWWDQWLLFTLPLDSSAPHSRITLPLVDQIPAREHWADEMNAKVYAYNQERQLSIIQEEFTETRRQLLERVSQLSSDDLYNPDGMATVIGQPVAPLILGIHEHYEEHAHELERLSR